ncbi:ketopantoate reductase family protein [Paenibacillus sedimenti]|uniref:2-dehydropantoate 2-reductase n=1 Tax=Paenibacillus sedimenti TaxID=2770274 RepID=A0A926KNA2_9BACL|nr:2-dehydropantoate 2-reductase [Paenibacillus sedimenti]MBD0379160.1 2-dehydropantoate 2-reductase [Paenibacillus sedimenti]
MRIMIVGAGSLGLLFGAKLFTVCDHITVVTKTREQAEALRMQGISLDGDKVISTNSNEHNIRFQSYDESVKEDKHPDFLFVMVKQPAIRDEFISYLKDSMSAGTIVVCFQNGIGHEEKLISAVGSDKLLLAVTTEAARKEGLTKVDHTGHGITYLGSLTRKGGPPQASQILLQDLLKTAGIEAEVSNEMEVRIWSKLIMNAVINPLTAILRVRNGELLESPWAMSLMRELYDEAMLVAGAKGIELPDNLWKTLLHVCKATAQNHSSMLQDLMQAKGTEIDSMNGSLLRIAKELKLELAVHQTVYCVVKALE